MSPFDFIKSFEGGEYLFDDTTAKGYVPYVINKMLSFSPATILYADEINRSPNLTPKQQHDFYFYCLPKRKRYIKWIKAGDIHADIELLVETYNINKTRAAEYLKLLSQEQVDIIRNKLNRGGRI